MIGFDTGKSSKNKDTTARKSTFFSPVTIQPKLTIGQPNDKYEQEADAMADKVMRMPQNTPAVQKKCAGCEQEEQVQPKRKGNFLSLKRMIQKMTSPEEETLQTKPLMMKSEGSGGVATSALTSQLNRSKGGGSPLPASTNQFMSNAIGSDFSGVRVHTGSKAIQMNQGLNARAFTHGSDVYFNKGEYSPSSSEGKRLLGHELTHVVQQGGGDSVQPKIQRVEDLGATSFSSKSATPSPPGTRLLERVFDGLSKISQHKNRSGPHVKLIQDSLLALGYTLPVFGADSDFGAETESAIRTFQIDSGANALDGIVGRETMRLLDMQGSGSTTGLTGAPTATAAAVFSEASNEIFAGYDASTVPDWMVVPVNERRRANVAVTPAGAIPTYVSDAPTVATVVRMDEGIIVTGVSHGTANIRAMQGATILARLRISVKNQLDKTVAFHFVCDSAVPPHCSDGTPSADTMRSLLNQVWHRQANIRFTGGATNNVVVPGNLGAAVNWTSALPGGGEWATVVATSTGADYNVFRVWRYMQDGTWPNDAANLGANTLVGDNPCADGWGLPHECGHFLGLGHGSGFIMTPCGGRVNQRVSKAMADSVNP